MATPRRKCRCASGDPDVGNDSCPTFSSWAAAGAVRARATTMQVSRRRMRTSAGILQGREIDRAASGRDSPEVVNLSEVIAEMCQEMDQKQARGDRPLQHVFGILRLELRIRKPVNN